MTLAIKICGLKSIEAARVAAAGGATHLGFIFFEKSPRHLSPEAAAALAAALDADPETARPHGPRRVAVTVDAGDDELDAIVAALRPDMLQLHGKESPERVAAVKGRHGLPAMKAVAIASAADFDAVAPYRGIADRFLFDARPPKGSEIPGGNAVSFDWALLAGVPSGLDWFLAGGIDAGNVGDAIRIANPPGLDISSGVESAPGVKDPGRIADFLAAVRAGIV